VTKSFDHLFSSVPRAIRSWKAIIKNRAACRAMLMEMRDGLSKYGSRYFYPKTMEEPLYLWVPVDSAHFGNHPDPE